MTEFILAWVLVTRDRDYGFRYSPAVATLEDCQRLHAFVDRFDYASQCIQVNVLKGK